MRLFLLPISTRRTFIYCQRLNEKLSGEASLVDKLTTRASTTWNKWEQSQTGWQKTITQYGNKVLERIPYEEWGLKSIPPLSAKRKDAELSHKDKVEIHFPGSLIRAERVESILTTLANENRPMHKRKLFWCCVGMPITIPIAVIPIVPNIPFFYLVFRAYSHWRALSGSKHIDFLLENQLLERRPSKILDTIYSKGLLEAGFPYQEKLAQEMKGETQVNEKEMVLLQESDGRLMAEAYDCPPLQAEVERAVRQIHRALKASAELSEEKQHIEQAKEEEQQTKK